MSPSNCKFHESVFGFSMRILGRQSKTEPVIEKAGV